MTTPGPPPAPMTRFEPTSRLHARLEEQAREIHELRKRLADALGELGRVESAHGVPPLGMQRAEGYAARPGPVSRGVLEPGSSPFWPRSSLAETPLRPAPGHRCAGITDPAVPVVAVSMCGLDRNIATERLDLVIEGQIERRSFVPLFVTDRKDDLDLFRFAGYDVELLPTMADLERCPGRIEPDAFLARRWQDIVKTWNVVKLVDFGSRPLEPRDGAVAMPARRPLIVFWKDYRRYNPYQHLLYSHLSGFDVSAGAIDHALATLQDDPVLERPVIFHLNWEEAIYRDAASAAEAVSLVDVFIGKLDEFMTQGGLLFWTVHNAWPHDNVFPQAYERLGRALAQRAGLILVHARQATDLLLERHGVERTRTLFLPHGNYTGVYPIETDIAGARQRLDLPSDGRTVLGFVGNVRPYKNVGLLLEAFAGLPRGTASLLIAGAQTPPLDLRGLDAMTLSEMRIIDRVIADEELASTIAACDALVLPYRDILTSGSLMLGLSLARPVIVPDLEPLREVVRDGEAGLVFARHDAGSLTEVLTRFCALDARARTGMNEMALAVAGLHDWGWIGRRLGTRLRALIERPSPPADVASSTAVTVTGQNRNEPVDA